MEQELDLLLESIKKAILSTVTTKKIGIAFSGGVDSTLITKICHDLGYDVTLLTIGFAESHDIAFAKQVNSFFHFPHKIFEIPKNSFSEVCNKIHEKISTDNLSWNENCIAFYYVSKLAKQHGIDYVITANGIDELFCGYNAYRMEYDNGENSIISLMNAKLENEKSMMVAVNKISKENGVSILQPLLSDEFIEFAKKIPLYEKISSKDDLIRKHIIRKLAMSIGVPEVSANKRKKALQYGSLIHKELIKTR